MLCTRIAKLLCSSPLFSSSRYLSTSNSAASKPRLRKSERLQRDVQLLSKILRSKATWGASTAKKLKQSNVEVTPYHVTEVLRQHRFPSIEPAWRFFRWAQQQKRCKRGVFMYSKMLQLLGSSGRFDDIWSLLDDMKRENRQITPDIFLGVIRSYVKAGQLDGALKSFHAMERYGCKPTTLVFNSMLDVLRSQGEYPQVESLFRKMKDPDLITYTMMIDCRGKAGEIEAAFELFQEMHRKGHKANVITYSSLISSLGKAGRVSEACNLLSGMRINGCQPNNVTYNALILSLSSAGRDDLAYVYYKEMTSLGLVANTPTQAAVVASLVKLGITSEAHALFQTASRSSSSEFDVMKSALGKAGGCEEAALRFFQEARGIGYEPSPGACSVMVYSLSKAGCVGDALNLFRECGDALDLMALNALMNALVKEQRFEDGVDVVRFMIKRRVGDLMYAYGKLVTLLCRANRFKDAREVISQEVPQEVHLWNKLIYQLGRAGQIEGALKTFEGMGHCDVESYNIVINLLGSVGKVDLAHQVLQQMQEKGCEPSLETYEIMIGFLVRSGRSALSIRVCREMVAKFPEGALKIIRESQDTSRGLEDTRGYSDLVATCMSMLKRDGLADAP